MRRHRLESDVGIAAVVPIALIIIGVVLIIAAWRNTYKQLGNLLVGDFTGSNSFLVWLGAVAIIGAIGYLPHMQTPSRMLMGLVFVVILISDKGFFSQLTAAFKSGPTSADSGVLPEPALQGNPTVNINTGGGSSGVLGQANSAIGGLSSLASVVGL